VVQALLKQNRAKLDEKLRSRPTLLERHSRALQADDAKVRFGMPMQRVVHVSDADTQLLLHVIGWS
jgi:hypothetical protein